MTALLEPVTIHRTMPVSGKMSEGDPLNRGLLRSGNLLRSDKATPLLREQAHADLALHYPACAAQD